MKKRTARHRRATGANGHRVSMTELDDKLSEWVGVARGVGPVIVDRYDSPWVCIVAYPTWHEISHLRSYIPDQHHALVALRDMIDDVLGYESEVTKELTARCSSGVAASFVIRAWVLQIVYSLGRAEQVREAMIYNLFWRWFIGYTEASEPLPDAEEFVQDMRLVSSDPRIVNAICRCLSSNVPAQAQAGEFRINFGLLHTLRDQHASAAQRDGAEGAAVPETGEEDSAMPA